MVDLLGIFKSELRVYYLALATAIVAVMLSTIFIFFRSVATLMMLMSGMFVMLVAIGVLLIAIYLDYTEAKAERKAEKSK
ncbi:MAG TPA: hypothetical protein HA257_04985 [Candidatus Methanoperedenaceae archaeon]|nr:hypothetical protein [Candidatus Methanoperedenaceae archaeon]